MKCAYYLLKKETSALHVLERWSSSNNPDRNTSARPAVNRNVPKTKKHQFSYRPDPLPEDSYIIQATIWDPDTLHFNTC